ncbi:M50 family metallopeptidase [Jatrophihabitans sp. DSM 45814]
MDVVQQVWQRVIGQQTPPSTSAVLGAGAVALLLVIPRPVWAVTRHLVTIAHEGAHAVAALATGRRLAGIRLHSDTSGLTVSKGKPRGPGMVLTFLAGYPGPALFGLGAAALLAAHRAVAVLWISLLLLALLLLQIRNWFGLWSVLVTGVAVFSVSWWLPERWQSGFAYLIAWFLLFAAPRPVVELQAKRRRRGAQASDADQLARLTRLPGLVWVAVFLAATLGALALGGYWLIATPT